METTAEGSNTSIISVKVFDAAMCVFEGVASVNNKLEVTEATGGGDIAAQIHQNHIPPPIREVCERECDTLETSTEGSKTSIISGKVYDADMCVLDGESSLKKKLEVTEGPGGEDMVAQIH